MAIRKKHQGAGQATEQSSRAETGGIATLTAEVAMHERNGTNQRSDAKTSRGSESASRNDLDASLPHVNGRGGHDPDAWMDDALDKAISLGRKGWSEKQVFESIDKDFPAPSAESREELHQMIRLSRAVGHKATGHRESKPGSK